MNRHHNWHVVSALRRGIACALAFSLATPVWAANEEGTPELSLAALMDEARETNPELAAARKRWEAAQAKVPLATGLPAPRIGLEWEEIPKGGVKFNKAMLMYQLIQSLPFPGKLSLRKQVAVKEAQLASMAFKQAEWDLISQVKTAYYDLFRIDRDLELQEEQVVWLSQAVAAAEAGYASGEGAQGDLVRAQAELLEASNARQVLVQRRMALAAHLNHLLNRPPHHPVGRPGRIEPRPIPYTPEELTLLAAEVQPELLAFRFSAQRAETAWRLAKRELLPDLETMVELRNPAMGPIGPWDLTLALVIPFWFWTKQRYGVKVALFDKESAQAAYVAAANVAAKRIHEHWHEAWAAYQTVALYRDGILPLAKQAVASTLAAYQSGRGSFMDLMDALRMLNERQRTYYEQFVMMEQHVVMLEQSAGVSLRADREEVS
jgi:outer membrane protein TolC